jgi:predicted CoA-substrate-specific enzyme activase
MGVENTRAVVMKDGQILGRARVSSGGADRPAQARAAYDEALRAAGVAAEDVEAITATGKGKFDIPFAGKTVTETTAAARAVRFLCPEAVSVMSAGADETLAAVLTGGGRPVAEYALNQKCSAGLGAFLKYLARRLGMTAEQLGAAEGPDAGAMNEGCVVFAETDALDMLNDGAAPEAVAASAVKAAAVRAATVFNDLTLPAGDCVALIGGLAKNRAFVHALENTLGLKFVIPGDAEYGGAVGAALSGAPA